MVIVIHRAPEFGYIVCRSVEVLRNPSVHPETYIQIFQPSHPGACVATILCHEVHHLLVDVGVGDRGQVALGEVALAEELNTKATMVRGPLSFYFPFLF